MDRVPLTVGFDLDMTLIDPRPGMIRAMNQLAEESGLPLDGEHFASHLGPPLRTAFLGFGVPEARIPALIDRYRAIYPEIVVPDTVPTPGAADALAAVRAHGGRIMVVTAKYAANARLHLDAFGWQVDEVVGDVWAAGKGEVLRAHGARIYVGDHEGDMHGAQVAGATAVGVTTGPCTEAELRAAGADVILPNLTGFADWLTESVAA